MESPEKQVPRVYKEYLVQLVYKETKDLQVGLKATFCKSQPG
jgi:hypothetical protein